MDDVFVTVIEADDLLNETKTYFQTRYKLDLWLQARFKDDAVRVPYAPGFERKSIRIRGLVLPKEEVLARNLLPEWPETIKYQRELAKKQIQKAKELAAQKALRHAEKGLALRFAGQNFFKTSGTIGAVADQLANPRGLGLRLKEAALMDHDLAGGKVLAKALIAKKANVNAKDEKGWTALHVCAWKDNSHITDVLLRSGRCDVNAQTNNGNTALHWAAQRDNRSTAEMLLLQEAVNVDAPNVMGQTPLHLCACYGSLAVTKVLLRCKASTEITSFELDTPVDIARRCKQQAISDHFALLRREERDAEAAARKQRARQQQGMVPGGSWRAYLYTSTHPNASPFLTRDPARQQHQPHRAASAGASPPSSSVSSLSALSNTTSVAGTPVLSSRSSGSGGAVAAAAMAAAARARRVQHGYRRRAAGRGAAAEEDPSTFHKSGFASSSEEEDDDDEENDGDGGGSSDADGDGDGDVEAAWGDPGWNFRGDSAGGRAAGRGGLDGGARGRGAVRSPGNGGGF